MDSKAITMVGGVAAAIRTFRQSTGLRQSSTSLLAPSCRSDDIRGILTGTAMSDPAVVALAEALANRYRFERELGRGGMATVWLARDLKHDRLVALKLLRSELGPILGAERFLREIQ